MREEGQAGFRVALRVELFHDQRIAGVEREEGEKVLAAHLVRRANVPFAVRGGHARVVRFVRILRGQGLQTAAAAVYERGVRGDEKIAAGGAYVESDLVQVAVCHAVFLQIAAKQRVRVDAQGFGYFREERKIRRAAAALPFGDGLVADTDLLGQTKLREVLPLAKKANQGSCSNLIHCGTSRSVL